MHWTDYLTPYERDQLHDLEQERIFAVAERRRIYDRCRQRMKRATPIAQIALEAVLK
jgi:hypothetical protein